MKFWKALRQQPPVPIEYLSLLNLLRCPRYHPVNDKLYKAGTKIITGKFIVVFVNLAAIYFNPASYPPGNSGSVSTLVDTRFGIESD